MVYLKDTKLYMSRVYRYKTQINVRLDAELKEELDGVVSRKRTTQSQFIRDAIVYYLRKKREEDRISH